MNKLNAFRKLIREEVKKALREELRSVLAEVMSTTATTSTSRSQPQPAKTLNQSPKIAIKETAFASQDPIQRLLAETAMGMDTNEYRNLINADSSMVQGFPQMAQSFSQPMTSEAKVVNSVEAMLATARPAADVTHVEIDSVPDFTGLMKTMKNKGQI